MTNDDALSGSTNRILSGALAYLALHMESACPRSAYLASLLLQRIADDPDNDAQLRHQAHLLAETIDAGGGRRIRVERVR